MEWNAVTDFCGLRFSTDCVYQSSGSGGCYIPWCGGRCVEFVRPSGSHAFAIVPYHYPQPA
jgi:hypothetical protein